MRLQFVVILCLIAAVAFWIVQVVCALRDRGPVTRVGVALLAIKTALTLAKQIRQIVRV